MAKNELRIDGAKFRNLIRRIDIAAEKFPEIRREMFERIGKELPGTLDTQIRSMFSPSEHHPNPAATVRGWQDDEGRVGSEGGYAAISPKAKTFKENTDYAVGYLTNTLTHGTTHVRQPSGRNARYRRRIKFGQIRRRPFYVNAGRALDREKNAIVEKFARELAQLLGEDGN